MAIDPRHELGRRSWQPARGHGWVTSLGTSVLDGAGGAAGSANSRPMHRADSPRATNPCRGRQGTSTVRGWLLPMSLLRHGQHLPSLPGRTDRQPQPSSRLFQLVYFFTICVGRRITQLWALSSLIIVPR